MIIKMILLIMVFLLVDDNGQYGVVNCKKKGSKKKIASKTPQEIVDDGDIIGSPRRPVNIKPEFYCAVCLSVMSELMQKLYKSKAEVDVSPAIDEVCSYKKYHHKEIYELKVKNTRYEYHPAQIAEGCNNLV